MALVSGAWNRSKNAARKGLLPVLTAVGVLGAMAPGAARADSTNAGIGAVNSAITGLSGDLSGIVTAAVAIALIGIGAVVALSLGKRLLGK